MLNGIIVARIFGVGFELEYYFLNGLCVSLSSPQFVTNEINKFICLLLSSSSYLNLISMYICSSKSLVIAIRNLEFSLFVQLFLILHWITVWMTALSSTFKRMNWWRSLPRASGCAKTPSSQRNQIGSQFCEYIPCELSILAKLITDFVESPE